jgi:signal transduction histidine kinase
MNFFIKNKYFLSVIGGLIVICLGIISHFLPFLCIPFVIFFSFLFCFLIFTALTFYELKIQKEKKIDKEIQNEKEKVLKRYSSFNNQLANVIAGINHEVSPWLGGIQNKIHRLRDKANKLYKPSVKNKNSISDEFSILNPIYVIGKLNEIEIAADTAIQILKTRSRDVKKLQKYSTSRSNLFDTINTWIGIAMVDRSVKGDISAENLFLHFDSLNFEVNHSPLLLSQIILNLVKNSVDHNSHMLENLLISISGDSTRKCLIYEDNGKGIDTDRIDNVFEPGITSKKFEKEIHGLGLSLCVDYCECMGSAIVAEKSTTGAKFVIYFDYDYNTNPQNIKNIDKKRGIID